MEELQAGDKKRFRIKVRGELVPQEKDNYCVCSVVQAILKGYDVDRSQREIADKLTPGKEGFLVQDGEIEKFLEANGVEWNFYWYNETPFNEPYSVLEEMSQYRGMIGIGNHTYLFRDFKGNEVNVIDPKDGSEVKKDYYDLLREMKTSEGFFGIIKKAA